MPELHREPPSAIGKLAVDCAEFYADRFIEKVIPMTAEGQGLKNVVAALKEDGAASNETSEVTVLVQGLMSVIPGWQANGWSMKDLGGESQVLAGSSVQMGQHTIAIKPPRSNTERGGFWCYCFVID